jgi:hypothetical protein
VPCGLVLGDVLRRDLHGDDDHWVVPGAGCHSPRVGALASVRWNHFQLQRRTHVRRVPASRGELPRELLGVRSELRASHVPLLHQRVQGRRGEFAFLAVRARCLELQWAPRLRLRVRVLTRAAAASRSPLGDRKRLARRAGGSGARGKELRRAPEVKSSSHDFACVRGLCATLGGSGPTKRLQIPECLPPRRPDDHPSFRATGVYSPARDPDERLTVVKSHSRGVARRRKEDGR